MGNDGEFEQYSLFINDEPIGVIKASEIQGIIMGGESAEAVYNNALRRSAAMNAAREAVPVNVSLLGAQLYAEGAIAG